MDICFLQECVQVLRTQAGTPALSKLNSSRLCIYALLTQQSLPVQLL